MERVCGSFLSKVTAFSSFLCFIVTEPKVPLLGEILFVFNYSPRATREPSLLGIEAAESTLISFRTAHCLGYNVTAGPRRLPGDLTERRVPAKAGALGNILREVAGAFPELAASDTHLGVFLGVVSFASTLSFLSDVRWPGGMMEWPAVPSDLRNRGPLSHTAHKSNVAYSPLMTVSYSTFCRTARLHQEIYAVAVCHSVGVCSQPPCVLPDSTQSAEVRSHSVFVLSFSDDGQAACTHAKDMLYFIKIQSFGRSIAPK